MLKVKNLSVKLGGKRILKDISFEVQKGESLVILGPNGAGKTTLLRAILGLIPHSGEVNWDTKNVSYLPPNELVRKTNLFPLTTNDFFSFKKASKKQIVEIIKAVGLKQEILPKKINTLSTGQFQRLIIAWALVDDPEVLIFDEPTSGIDVGGQETIYTLLHKFWKERGLTTIVVTHELNVVWEHANNVLCLNKAKVFYGKPEKALTPKRLKELYGTGIKFHKHK